MSPLKCRSRCMEDRRMGSFNSNLNLSTYVTLDYRRGFLGHRGVFYSSSLHMAMNGWDMIHTNSTIFFLLLLVSASKPADLSVLHLQMCLSMATNIYRMLAKILLNQMRNSTVQSSFDEKVQFYIHFSLHFFATSPCWFTSQHFMIECRFYCCVIEVMLSYL